MANNNLFNDTQAHPFVVFSPFDGISCAQLAISQLTNNYIYYASEIEKKPIEVTNNKFPNTIQLGDIRTVTGLNFAHKIDLMIGGSPCQNLSRQANNEAGLNGDKSILFYEFVRLLHELKPRYFILENVASMTDTDKKIISTILKCEPIKIDAALVSGQRRKRYFWTNIPNVQQPDDRGILLKDILEKDAPVQYLWSEKNSYTSIFSHHIDGGGFKVKSGNKEGFEIAYVGDVVDCSFATSATKRSRVNRDKAPTITLNEDNHFVVCRDGLRRFTVTEYERLQSIPEGYTNCIAKTPAYDAIGNAFNVEAVKHIMSYIPELNHSQKQNSTSLKKLVFAGKKIIRKYPGSKSGSGVYQKIINEMPVHEVYIEAFLGGGAIMLKKKPAEINIGIDNSARVVAAWKHHNIVDLTVLEMSCIKYLNQLLGKSLDNRKTLIYIDAPYLKDSRSTQVDLYEHESTNKLHLEIFKVVKLLNCNIMISHYKHDLYTKHLSGWRMISYKCRTRGETKTEYLWCNFLEPESLHDTKFIGGNFREREVLNRKRQRWVNKFKSLEPKERQAIIELMKEEKII